MKKKAPPRKVLYSPDTTRAYGNVIDVCMGGGSIDDINEALRHLMTMVHCDYTGELRQPHTHIKIKEAR